MSPTPSPPPLATRCPSRAETTPAMTNDVPAVRVDGLVYRYPDGRLALRGVDLTIAAGETVALVGPNGAGKSTLLLHLNGILPGKERGQPLHAHGAGAVAKNGAPAVWIDGL